MNPLYPTVLKLFKSKHQLSMEIPHDPSGNWRSTPEAPLETDTTHDEAWKDSPKENGQVAQGMKMCNKNQMKCTVHAMKG